MKKLLFILTVLASLRGAAQAPVNLITFIPYVTSKVHVSDSVQIAATLYSTSTVTGVTFKQISGPAMTTPPAAQFWSTGFIATGSFWVKGLAPGTYVWQATGANATTTALSPPITLTVVPDSVCPVLTPRTVTSLQILIDGVLTTVPITGAKFGFSDGGNQ